MAFKFTSVFVTGGQPFQGRVIPDLSSRLVDARDIAIICWREKEMRISRLAGDGYLVVMNLEVIEVRAIWIWRVAWSGIATS